MSLSAPEIDLNNEFVSENLRLVHSCCHRLSNRGIEYEELFSAGCLGLVKAIKGFDKGRNLAFSTYAVPVILGEIRRLFRDGGSVKISRSLKEMSLKVSREKQKLALELSREPTIEELGERLDLSREQITEAICASNPTVSLTVSDEDGETTECELPTSGGEEEFLSKHALYEAIETLPQSDKELITLRYFKHKTQSETAKTLGMTQVQVSRKEKVILLLLRKELL